MMTPVAEAVKVPVKRDVKDVRCPHCARYIGAFLGKAQCASCKTWVKV